MGLPCSTHVKNVASLWV